MGPARLGHPPGTPRKNGFPYRRLTAQGREPFSSSYARARSIGYERLAFGLLAISDADCIGPDGRADNALVQKQRLQADTRKWLLSKLLPRQYGDRVTAEIAGDNERPLISRIELVAVAPPPRPPQELLVQDDSDAVAGAAVSLGLRCNDAQKRG